jgi:hypothetical protein
MMHVAMAEQSAALLETGMVLEAGGASARGHAETAAELYNPATNRWSDTGDLNVPRYGQASVLLANGDVLVAGGLGGCGYPCSVVLSSTELYHPDTGTWSLAASLAAGRETGSLVLLGNAQALLVGGADNYGAMNSAELYASDLDTWSSAAAMTNVRWGQATVPLPDGRALVAGGFNGYCYLCSALATAEVYSPEAPVVGLWATPNPVVRRSLVKILGYGFQPGETVQITAGGSLLGSATADADGATRLRVRLLGNLRGIYSIEASGAESGRSATALLLVTFS